MFNPGDVVRIYSPTAGKEKFHLCLCVVGDGERNLFLYLNSNDGYAGDCILDDGRIPGLPVSPTGKTVVSFSAVIKMNEKKLKIFKAQKTGEIDELLAGELLAFAKTTKALTDIDKPNVIEALENMLS